MPPRSGSSAGRSPRSTTSLPGARRRFITYRRQEMPPCFVRCNIGVEPWNSRLRMRLICGAGCRGRCRRDLFGDKAWLHGWFERRACTDTARTRAASRLPVAACRSLLAVSSPSAPRPAMSSNDKVGHHFQAVRDKHAADAVRGGAGKPRPHREESVLKIQKSSTPSVRHAHAGHGFSRPIMAVDAD